MNNFKTSIGLLTLSTLLIGCSNQNVMETDKTYFKVSQQQPSKGANEHKKWLAGDHHIHGKYSAKWDVSTNPPTPILRGDAQYATAVYAKMAQLHGLSWMVTTDHGGPNHSELNLHQAYPELIVSRLATPEVLQFYGMEFDVPGARHSSLIIPYSDQESQQLYAIEKNYNRREVEPDTSSRDSNEFMLKALKAMDSQPLKPVLIVNHPARLSKELGQYNKVTPAKLRSWKDAAPDVVIGMEGAPGHQANALNPDGTIRHTGQRGGYQNYPTMGGFDQMTAKLGGVWDSMLGEGRRWWITSASDSHMHYTEGRTDFWPGEYSKTYVYAEKNYEDVLQNLREGHVFVTTGDLISELFVTVKALDTSDFANVGDELTIPKNTSVEINVTFLDPSHNNANSENPSVSRVDIIAGNVLGVSADKNSNVNTSTKILTSVDKSSWTNDGVYTTFSYVLDNLEQDMYIRVRGTNGKEIEPEPDFPGENPWSDLWFYSNPVFIDTK